MNAVFNDFDAYLEAFGYTLWLFLVAGVLSMVLGTLLVAMRVGPIAVLARAAAVYVTIVRNTPLVIIFVLLRVRRRRSSASTSSGSTSTSASSTSPRSSARPSSR